MDFANSCMEADVSGFAFARSLPVFAERVIEKAKHQAKLVSRATGRAHRTSLEDMARAVGFPDWHAMQTAAKRLSDRDATPTSKAVDNKALDPFAATVPLLINLYGGAPEPGQRKALERLATSIAKAFGIGVQQALDAIALTHQAGNWRLLLGRKAEDSGEPMYTFRVLDEGEGEFDSSRACHKLRQECFSLIERFPEKSPRDRDAVWARLEQIDALRPDFCAVEFMVYLTHPNGQELEPRVRQAITRFEAMIPQGIRRISWMCMGSRPYLLLLFWLMESEAKKGKVRRAIALARKQLRLNPNDNTGARFYLPAYLYAVGDVKGGDRHSAWHRDEYKSNGRKLLVRGLGHVVAGRNAAAVRELLEAVFNAPMIAAIMRRETLDLYGDAPAHSRGTIHEPGAIAATLDVLSDTDAVQFLEDLLEREDVQRAEAQLAKLWDQEWNEPRRLWRRGEASGPMPNRTWDARVKELAAEIATHYT